MTIDRRTLLQGGLAAGITSLLPTPASAAAHRDDAKIDAFVKANGFAGTIVRARNGRLVYARNFGLANIAAKTPATTETVYGIASISKFLTTVTVLKLVEAGKLALDAPIATLLPGYRADTGAKVTLAHLLSNTSGIPNAFTNAVKAEMACSRYGCREQGRHSCGQAALQECPSIHLHVTIPFEILGRSEQPPLCRAPRERCVIPSYVCLAV